MYQSRAYRNTRGMFLRPSSPSGCIASVNERLRSVLAQRGVTIEGLAEACRVDPKTVNRWIGEGRVPHARHRFTASQHLNVDETYLWPIKERRAPVLNGAAE